MDITGLVQIIPVWFATRPVRFVRALAPISALPANLTQLHPPQSTTTCNLPPPIASPHVPTANTRSIPLGLAKIAILTVLPVRELQQIVSLAPM